MAQTQQLSDRPDTESAAHSQRVAALARRLTARLRLPPGRAFELCNGFDEAVECAAFEGRSIDEAISEFILDGWGPERVALGMVAGCFSPACRPDTHELPVMSTAVSRLLRTTEEAASVVELEEMAASDRVLSARLLKTANSGQFGPPFKGMNLRDAILRVGVSRSRRIAFHHALGGLFRSQPLNKLWDHSQSVADLAFQLARFCGTDAETAYVGGLMHDIGRLGLVKFPAEQRTAEGDWLGAGFPRVYAETLAYGVDHAAVGAEMLLGWEVPERIVEGVARHQRPGRSESLLGATLYLADDLAESAGSPAAHQPEDLWSGMRRRIACERTGITLDRLQAFNEMRSTSPELACT